MDLGPLRGLGPLFSRNGAILGHSPIHNNQGVIDKDWKDQFSGIIVIWTYQKLGPDLTFLLSLSCILCKDTIDVFQASVTILADFGPEFNPPFRWRSKNQTKNHSAYH